MMGELPPAQNELFYDFCLEKFVPEDHLLRHIDSLLDLSRLRHHLKPFYSRTGRPSVDPELMVRMLIIGYCFGIRHVWNWCNSLFDTKQTGESPRVLRRLQLLREWSHEQVEQVFT